MKKSVFDLFSIDLRTLPNSDCIESGKKSYSTGYQITTYLMALNKPELGLFKMAEIFKFDNGNVNVGLSNPNLSSLKISKLEKVINTLFTFYGKDSSDLGAFTSNDQSAIEESISDPENAFWMGRMWYDLDDHAVMISIDDKGLTLFIHGTSKGN